MPVNLYGESLVTELISKSPLFCYSLLSDTTEILVSCILDIGISEQVITTHLVHNVKNYDVDMA